MKIRPKNQKSADFPFFLFLFLAILFHWYQDWVKVKHAGMQSETRGVQNFGAKSGARAAKQAAHSPAVQQSN